MREPLVLIADDDPGIRDALMHLLQDAGYRVQTAGDGWALIDLARAERPDAVVLDLVMPGHDGIETAMALRSLPQMENVPIIAATSMWLGDRLDLLEPSGFTASLRKPFNVDAVLALLQSTMGQSPDAAVTG